MHVKKMERQRERVERSSAVGGMSTCRGFGCGKSAAARYHCSDFDCVGLVRFRIAFVANLGLDGAAVTTAMATATQKASSTPDA